MIELLDNLFTKQLKRLQ